MNPQEVIGQAEPFAPNGSRPVVPADPEVAGGNKHRRYSTAYKLRILEEAERQRAQATLGAFLRREGLYASTLRDFKRQRDQGLLTSPSPTAQAKRAAQKSQVEAQVQELTHLRQENRQLRRQLKHSELLREIAGKACELLGLPLGEEEG